MKFPLPLIVGLLLLSPVLNAAKDPVSDCRQQYADDPAAHISCLESAVHRLSLQSESAKAAAKAANSMGVEQVKQNQRASGEITDQPILVRITSFAYNSQGMGQFRLENGQVWRETEKSPRQYRPETGQQYEATIERGKVGGYRMQVEGIRRMLKVERLK